MYCFYWQGGSIRYFSIPSAPQAVSLEKRGGVTLNTRNKKSGQRQNKHVSEWSTPPKQASRLGDEATDSAVQALNGKHLLAYMTA